MSKKVTITTGIIVWIITPILLSYIYDIKTMKKVGINSKEEFFLSCDPFILGQM